jgi:hypothetical protein
LPSDIDTDLPISRTACETSTVRYRLRVDAVISGADYADALRRIGEHFIAWADDTPSDDPDGWVAEASLAAPQFEVGGVVHLVPDD